MSKIKDILTDKEFRNKYDRLKTPYKILYMLIMAGFMLVGFTLFDWQIGAIGAGIVAFLAYFPTRLIMNMVIKNKGESVFYPTKKEKMP